MSNRPGSRSRDPVRPRLPTRKCLGLLFRQGGGGASANASAPVLETRDPVKHFVLPRTIREGLRGAPPREIHAVDGVSLHANPGEVLGLIGESGSGKTTLGWLIARLHPSTSGEILFEGEEVTRLRGTALRAWHRKVQMVFPDPIGSLDPRFRVWQIVGEPMRAEEGVHGHALRERVRELLPTVGLPPIASTSTPTNPPEAVVSASPSHAR